MRTQLLLFVLATAALALTPGPNTVLTISRTVAQGRFAGIAVIAGVEAAFLVHLVAAAAGITAIVLFVPAVFDALRLLGGAYLLYLAWSMMTSRQALAVGGGTQSHSVVRLFRAGFVSNVLNPKTAIFYLAAFPQFATAMHVSPATASLRLGLVHICVSTCCNLLYVLAAARLVDLLRRRPGLDRARRYLFGSIMVVFAGRVMATPRPLGGVG